MPPRRAFQLSRIRGIRVSVGISWFFVLFLFIFAVTGPFHELLGGMAYAGYGAGRCNCEFGKAYNFAFQPRLGFAFDGAAMIADDLGDKSEPQARTLFL